MRAVRTQDGSFTLYSEEYGQAMHSLAGAISEARHVFLEGAHMRAMLAHRRAAAVLEVGFGTGLNFLVTLDAAVAAGATLHYTALERALPGQDVLERLDYSAHLAAPVLWNELLVARRTLPGVVPVGRYRFTFAGANALSLLIGNATDQAFGASAFDAVYHDGFSPAVNPELWSGEFLGRLAAGLKPGGRLASFCVSGSVRQALCQAGLEVVKYPGPVGGKREVLKATKRPGATASGSTPA